MFLSAAKALILCALICHTCAVLKFQAQLRGPIKYIASQDSDHGERHHRHHTHEPLRNHTHRHHHNHSRHHDGSSSAENESNKFLQLIMLQDSNDDGRTHHTLPTHETLIPRRNHTLPTIPTHETLLPRRNHTLPTIPTHETLLPRRNHTLPTIPTHETLIPRENHTFPTFPSHVTHHERRNHTFPTILPPRSHHQRHHTIVWPHRRNHTHHSHRHHHHRHHGHDGSESSSEDNDANNRFLQLIALAQSSSSSSSSSEEQESRNHTLPTRVTHHQRHHTLPSIHNHTRHTHRSHHSHHHHRIDRNSESSSQASGERENKFLKLIALYSADEELDMLRRNHTHHNHTHRPHHTGDPSFPVDFLDEMDKNFTFPTMPSHNNHTLPTRRPPVQRTTIQPQPGYTTPHREPGPYGAKLTCDVPPMNTMRPTSVHALRPSDIQVVAALGDSLTAGFGAGATTVGANIVLEYRGISFSIGGDDTLNEMVTLPNILRAYNPNLVGFSTGIGPVWMESSQLNVAVPGAVSGDLKDQAVELVDRMRARADIDFQNDWKLITIFVSGNDLCSSCMHSLSSSPSAFVRHLKSALDYLADKVPRAFVNVISAVDITTLFSYKEGLCPLFHKVECPCVTEEYTDTWDELKQRITEYQNKTRELVNNKKYQNSDSFVVVVQPIVEKVIVPYTGPNGTADLSYMAPDCFHFSQKMHAAAARALWQSMLTPTTTKDRVMDEAILNRPIVCPDKVCPYLRTARNSKSCVAPSNEIDFVDPLPPHLQHLAADVKGQAPSKTGVASQADALVGGIIGVAVAAMVVLVVAVLLYGHRRRSHRVITAKASETTPLLASGDYGSIKVF